MLSFTPAIPLRRHHAKLPTTATHSTTRMSLNTKPIIVGGGPAGALLAASFSLREIPCTLLERSQNFVPFDLSRAYTMRVNARGVSALSSIPDLLDIVSEEGSPCSSMTVTALFPDGTVTPIRQDISPDYASLDYRFVRAGLSQGLRRFLERTSVNALYGATVTDITFLHDGHMIVEYTHEGVSKTSKTNLVLACDGIRSQVAAATARSRNATLRGKHGLGVTVYNTPAVGLCVRSISVNPDTIKSLFPELQPQIDHVRVLVGKRSSENFFIALYPTPEKYIKHCRGFLGTIVKPDNHPVWRIKSVEEAYELFQSNFPQVDVRKLITTESMQEFISEAPVKFGAVRRRDSLVVHVGENGTGGVVFLGDAANSAPPDIGQGVNSAFQDVEVLTKVIDDMSDASIAQILDTYEARRETDIDALVTLQRFASPYQYGQTPIRGLVYGTKRKIRKLLAGTFEGLLYPSYADMLLTRLSYSEIVRRSDASARVILFTTFMVLAVPFLAVLLRFIL